MHPDPGAPPAAARHWLHASVSVDSPSPAALDCFSDGCRSLDRAGRHEILRSLAATGEGGAEHPGGEKEDGGAASAFYRPKYVGFLEAMNAQPGGLKILAAIRADLLALLEEENAPALRALDRHMKEKLGTWLSPTALAFHQITWDDPASLREKIVAYEAVHPMRSLTDLKRRLDVGRCFAYFHPAIPGEPLIFIQVALLKDMATSIQEVLLDVPPIPEREAKCALFYSMWTQPGLSGIDLDKFLLNRIIDILRRDMPSVQIFATLSPILGFMQWLLGKLGSQIKLAETELQEGNSLEGAGSTFRESILLPEEEKLIQNAVEQVDGKQEIELLQDILKSSQWLKSDKLSAALKSPLMRLCARYLASEKKQGKALDPIANFHLQNGAMIERINWMADKSEKGIKQSGGIMVNYLYRLESIEEYALSYSGTGHIHTSPSLF